MMTETHEEYLRAYRASNATPEELNEILGPSWGICRKTPNNLSRYARCITRKEYEAANKLALERRAKAVSVKKYRVHLGGKRYKRFETLEAASTFCSDHFKRTGVVLSITERANSKGDNLK